MCLVGLFGTTDVYTQKKQQEWFALSQVSAYYAKPETAGFQIHTGYIPAPGIIFPAITV